MNKINNIIRRKFLEIFGTCICALMITSCSTAPITERKQLKLIPESTLNNQAAQIYEKVKQKTKLSDNKKKLDEIKEIGSRIEKAVSSYFASINENDPTYNFQWEYILVDNDKIKNAWCMPGGKIAVYTGILEVTKNKHGLAAVMGHEIAHAVAKHSIERASRALVLNADYRPLSYYPLSLWSWQDSVKSVFLDRVTIVNNYDRIIRSPSFSMRLPSVIALKNFISPKSNPNFTRFNVFLRDKFKCQYCGSGNELTFDHLLPRSRGGKTDWNNVVTACSDCNVKKGGSLFGGSGMILNQKPYQPSTEDLHKSGKNFPPNFLHKSWMDYLYWDVELEP